MKRFKTFVFLFVLIVVLALLFYGATQQKQPTSKEPTAFQKRCSVCHSLAEVRTGMENIMKEMHEKAGIELSDQSLKEIEETFTLLPVDEPTKVLFQEKCGQCHSLDMVVIAHQTKSEAEMEEIISRMAKKHDSKISKEEIDKIHQSMLMLNEIYEPDVELKRLKE